METGCNFSDAADGLVADFPVGWDGAIRVSMETGSCFSDTADGLVAGFPVVWDSAL